MNRLIKLAAVATSVLGLALTSASPASALAYNREVSCTIKREGRPDVYVRAHGYWNYYPAADWTKGKSDPVKVRVTGWYKDLKTGEIKPLALDTVYTSFRHEDSVVQSKVDSSPPITGVTMGSPTETKFTMGGYPRYRSIGGFAGKTCAVENLSPGIGVGA